MRSHYACLTIEAIVPFSVVCFSSVIRFVSRFDLMMRCPSFFIFCCFNSNCLAFIDIFFVLNTCSLVIFFVFFYQHIKLMKGIWEKNTKKESHLENEKLQSISKSSAEFFFQNIYFFVIFSFYSKFGARFKRWPTPWILSLMNGVRICLHMNQS